MNIGNLQEKPWYFRLAIFAGVALVIYGGFWYLVTSGTRAEIKNLNEQIAVLLQRNAQAQIASQHLNEFRATFKNKQAEYDELKALLPEQRELTAVLQGIEDRAHTSNLELRRFTPKDDVQQDFYSGKRIDVGVSSTFAGLRAFFDQMARYQRIVSITNFEVKQMDKPSAGKTVDARFDLTAYYLSPEKPQKPAAPQPGAPAAPAPGASPPAPAPAK
jgi:Tfp pilus assembly protein PilO